MKDQGESSRKKIRQALQDFIEHSEGNSPKKSDLSVSKLLEQAGVSRGTFYAYYNNMEDALEDLIMDFSNRLIDRMRLGRQEVPGINGLEQGYLHILELIYEHPTLFRVVFEQKKLGDRFLGMVIEYLFQQYCIEMPNEDRELLYYTAVSNSYFIYGMLAEWEKEGYRKTPQEMADIFAGALRLSKRIEALY